MDIFSQALPPECSRSALEGTGDGRGDPPSIEVTLLSLNDLIIDSAEVNSPGVESNVIEQFRIPG
jgi:hypothetical protein